ncbi:MAG: YceI family protein [Chitinophagaceae bacterium]
MNNKTSITSLILIIAPLFFGCGGNAKGEKGNNAPGNPLSLHVGDEKYIKIDKKESVITWKGSGPMGSHTGYVYVSQGELMIKNGELMGGAVEVDMSTIVGDDHRNDNNLIDHLKNPDFFDVKKFPNSTIAITRVAPINVEVKEITANLTIKGITHPVTFPARIEVKDSILEADARLVIDRTKWGVRYNSGTFFDNLKDQAIADSIEFNIKVVTKL